jgi:hypothetical protein
LKKNLSKQRRFNHLKKCQFKLILSTRDPDQILKL